MSNHICRSKVCIGLVACYVVVVQSINGHAQLITGKVPVGNLGHELYFESQGSGEPVVLIHGLTLDLREWDAQVNALADEYQVIRYDVVGHGRSSGLSSSLPNGSVRDWEYLRDLLDELDVDKAHVVGLSMGGGIAINFALQYPDRVQTLTPIDARLGGYNVPSELGNRFNGYLNVSRSQDVQAALPLWAADPLFAPANANPEVRAQLEQIVIDGHGALGAGAMFQWPNILKPAELSPPAMSRLNEIDIPTLVMIGERDLIDFQNQADILDRDIPNSTKLVVPNAGHMSDMEQPEFVSAALLDFFAAHPLSLSLPGDFSNDGRLDAVDIELLSAETRAGTNNVTFDITSDGLVNDDDRQHWVTTLRKTWFGDANIDGLFDSADLVEVFTVGEYEDGIDDNSVWAEGDWDGNADFESGDFVKAFIDGGYEAGQRGPLAAVPEPSSSVITLLGIVAVCRRRSVRRGGRQTAGKFDPQLCQPLGNGRWLTHRCGWMLCLMLLVVALTSAVHADIHRWDTGELIRGTEGIEPGPELQLDKRDLRFANLSDNNLSGSNFAYSNLAMARFANAELTGASFFNAKLDNADFRGSIITGAYFAHSTLSMDTFYSTASYAAKDLQGIWLTGHDLTGWDFSEQDLRGAWLGATKLDNVNLTGAVVAGTYFGTTNLTREQLYSTASYQAKDLQGIGLSHNNLTDWDFSAQDLTGADLSASTLTNVDLTGAIVTQANFANYFGATNGISKEQLYSTASYQSQDLHGIRLSAHWGPSDLSGWDLSRQDLSGAVFAVANLTNTDLGGAIVTDADFGGTASRGLTKEQLYSTASYQAKNLRGIKLNGFDDPWRYSESDLTGWDFSGQDLTGADLSSATLTDVNLSGTVVAGVNFSHTTKRGLTKEQLYSTASYQAKNLRGIAFTGDYCCSHDDLSGWDLSQQDLAGALIYRANLSDVNLTGANLMNAWLFAPNDSADRAVLTNANLSSADTRGSRGLDLADSESRNTILPDGKIMGLDLASGERILVRDDDGVPDAGPPSWPPPRGSIPITIYSQMNMAEGSELQFQFDADPWGSRISFDRGIPVELGGKLLLTFADDVDLASQVGRTLQVFDWSSVSPSGAFHVTGPYSWDLSNLYTTGEVRLTAVPEPGGNVTGLLGLSVGLTASSRLRSAHRRQR